MRWFVCFLLVINLAYAADVAPDAIAPDGARYYGTLRKGKFEGHGRLEWDNGTQYEGGFQDGMFSGRGRLRASDGRSYNGEFARGQFDGRGRFEAPSGETYEGDFVNGEFTGRGNYSRPDGARYRGAPSRRFEVFSRATFSSTSLRRRTESGVTSTHSSSRRNSSEASRVNRVGGASRTSTSALDARMLVCCLALVGLTSRSSARAFSPTIMPS